MFLQFCSKSEVFFRNLVDLGIWTFLNAQSWKNCKKYWFLLHNSSKNWIFKILSFVQSFPNQFRKLGFYTFLIFEVKKPSNEKNLFPYTWDCLPYTHHTPTIHQKILAVYSTQKVPYTKLKKVPYPTIHQNFSRASRASKVKC